ncbi:MAG: DUF393 domain-containing protein [Phycisphaerales bacterium]|nr:DUF393 domain-containing protein [Phycisphaerales bacterium]
MTAPFTILIDGQCSLCRREGRLMQRLDNGRGRLRIVDITAPDFVPAHFGTTADAVMGQIHGVSPDGTLLAGLEVFRRSYAALAQGGPLQAKAMSALFATTDWPLIRPLANAAYRWFARHRVAISTRVGRWIGDAPVVCENDRCKV